MGQYSYNQPSSSSNSQDLTSLLQAEAEMYAAEAEISQWNAEAIHYEPSPEGDDGIPRTCYCGSEPVHGYSQTPKHPYRRYITCANADDGDCHVWKWWDVAVEEEMRDIQTELSELKGEANEREQKLLILEKRIGEFTKKKSGAKLMKSWKGFKGVGRTIFVSLTSQGPDESGSEVPVASPVLSGTDVSAKSGVNSNPSERRKWTPTEDKIFIGAWLNTSKDPVVSNEQKAGAFWFRIVEYYNASPLLAGTIRRELMSCKQRWARINGDVAKFAGSYDAALREQRSGQNDDDKWCSSYPAKEKRKQAVEVDTEEEQFLDPEVRPPGVKAAKDGKKKKSGREEELSQLQGVLEIKQKLSKQKLLDRLLAKTEPLSEMETSLKLKLMLTHVGRRHRCIWSDACGKESRVLKESRMTLFPLV
uniref:Myb-like domain-containing protein n=1 Tax=Brassica oleracea var. oleracea TaxID=109376 RepID=A0A0D3EFS6_BRAOL